MSEAVERLSLTVNAERCVGHGRCYSLAPELFDCDDYGNAIVLVPEPATAEQVNAARTAVASCPEGAIRLRRTAAKGTGTQA